MLVILVAPVTGSCVVNSARSSILKFAQVASDLVVSKWIRFGGCSLSLLLKVECFLTSTVFRHRADANACSLFSVEIKLGCHVELKIYLHGFY